MSAWGKLRDSQVKKAIVFAILGDTHILHINCCNYTPQKDFANTKQIVQLNYNNKHSWNESTESIQRDHNI